MRLRLLVVLWLCVPGCGPPGDFNPPQQAKFEVFTLTLDEVVEGQEVKPTTLVGYHIAYQGDLARNLTVEATVIDTATGEIVSQRARLLDSSPDRTTRNEASAWKAVLEEFKRPGRFEVTLTASILATLKDSVPFTVSAPRFFVVSNARLDSLVVSPVTATPALYGTPLTVTVQGEDLWDEVDLTLEHADTGGALLGLHYPFTPETPTSRMSKPWTILYSGLEHVGVHRLRAVATFGISADKLVVRSEPFSIEVTHTIEQVSLTVLDASGTVIGGEPSRRMDRAKDFVLRITGVNLAGHEVELTGEPPFIAPSDSFERIRTPTTDDFAEGIGTHDYHYQAKSGGITRSASIDMRRWQLESCGWYKDGVAVSGTVPLDADVTLEARGWGFPDTTGILIFKQHQAQFKLWERDDGQNNTSVPMPWVNNDDEVDTFNGDVLNSVAAYEWTTEFDEEVQVLTFNNAEYYFEVTWEDAKCTSGEISVPSE